MLETKEAGKQWPRTHYLFLSMVKKVELPRGDTWATAMSKELPFRNLAWHGTQNKKERASFLGQTGILRISELNRMWRVQWGRQCGAQSLHRVNRVGVGHSKWDVRLWLGWRRCQHGRHGIQYVQACQIRVKRSSAWEQRTKKGGGHIKVGKMFT